ncbi:hypothetical protein N7532_007255 [Penicillium argentinense]|uniref:CBM-cenC domain-containing protein n=1 Tax=Penicillium argentinense TaxID=1131581 RepID=A0A9W9K6K8_9EURO|nr:uncharacterized protein N7532_007255 [Penicillium argentinense]KAJ5094964.1 hypothetical protein N7532_007255 [Penicillium argentinense]
MALSACNAVLNPSFETGTLKPWFSSAVNVAKVTSGTSAYSGEYYLNLQTAVGNRGNTISQHLKHLKPHEKYDFSVQVQVPSPSGSEYCSVYVYMGRNATIGAIASTQLFDLEEWTALTGTYTAKRSDDILNIVVACDSEDSSVTGNVLIDDVNFTGREIEEKIANDMRLMVYFAIAKLYYKIIALVKIERIIVVHRKSLPVRQLRIVGGLRELAVPGFELKTEVHPLVESLEYFNNCMYPRLSQILLLSSNINIYRIPAELFKKALHAPDYAKLGLVCITLSHRMNQSGHNPDSKSLEKNFYNYRGHVIRSLNNDLHMIKKRDSHRVLTGILTLLLLDAQQGISQHWRYHMEGVRGLITLRGGMHKVAVQFAAMPIVLCYVFLAVNGDTASPASDMLITSIPADEIYLVIKQFGGNGFAFQMCPMSLFVEIMNINRIRARASIAGLMEEGFVEDD